MWLEYRGETEDCRYINIYHLCTCSLYMYVLTTRKCFGQMVSRLEKKNNKKAFLKKCQHQQKYFMYHLGIILDLTIHIDVLS